MRKIEVEEGEPLCEFVSKHSGSIQFKKKEMYLLWGESKAGKSWLSLWIAKKLAGVGLKGVFIDTEGKIRNLVYSWKTNDILTNKHLENLDLYWEPDSLEEVPEMINDSIDFIMVDTVTGPYDDLHPKKRAKLISRNLGKIKKAIMDYEVLCILTTGMYEKWEDSHKYRIRGGEPLRSKPNHQLFIKKMPSDDSIMDRKRIITYDKKQEVAIKVDKSFSRLEVINGKFKVLKNGT